MEKAVLWFQIKELFIDIVKYLFPTIAIILSIISFCDSRKANKLKDRLTLVEKTLKEYELEEKENERLEKTKACVEARIVRISKGNYKLKVWNSGKATAYNVDFQLPEECNGMVIRSIVPFEFLESGKSFEEIFLVSFQTPSKLIIITTWVDEHGNPYLKEQMVSI